ncbi:PREDICTED: F-box/kelch-repeat protein OR23-like [Tarenaya hassleriana]|uniref:F-box/kelch-repeat protein OR23-like n=1 Tax=Tarenaya hassleriana TaxID=28532 RepID=UPI00053C5BF9|nr:PREDICTED: F-box/kelch-repeat protein OR23-like [Tarenaya hassleriana]
MPLPPSLSSPSLRPRPRVDHSCTLIPGLPNDVAALILSFVPYPQIPRLKSTCKSWYAFLSSKTLMSLRHRRHTNSLSHLLCIFPEDPSISNPYLFDPETLSWLSLPFMPCNPHVYGLCNFAAVALGPYLYVLGGSAFDTRSYPLDRPMPSSSAFRYNFVNSTWERLAPMLSSRGSFACAAMPGSNRIIVAGGGSRHTLFGAAGSRMSSVEMYDVERDEWMAMDGLPRFRAGCVGFLVWDGEETEFWVMGGYGGSRTVSGILPVDEYYRDAVVMELRSSDGGGKWRLIGDMWGQGERARLGKIVAIDEGDRGKVAFFMLDGDQILRYEMDSNRWRKESTLPRKAPYDRSFGFIALNGELHVMSLLDGFKTRPQEKGKSMMSQIYHPRKKIWRSLVSRPPFIGKLDFRTSAMCSVRL